MNTAKIITVLTPQPAVMQLVPQPDKEEKLVQVNLTMEQAEVILWLSGTELNSPVIGRRSLDGLFDILLRAGVNEPKKLQKALPARHQFNSGAWYWTANQIPQAPIIPPPIEKKRVILELSINEAETLGLLLAKCGGTPSKSRRGYCDAMRDALQNAGYHWTTIVGSTDRYEQQARLDDVFEQPGGLCFKNEKLDPSKD
jgi:hypothetical protein